MLQTHLYPDWREKIVYSSTGAQPQMLLVTDRVKILLAGLEAGQTIPEHAEAGAMYHFLEGNGWIVVDGERLQVSSGATVIMPEGAVRGMEAETRLAFLAVRLS